LVEGTKKNTKRRKHKKPQSNFSCKEKKEGVAMGRSKNQTMKRPMAKSPLLPQKNLSAARKGAKDQNRRGGLVEAWGHQLPER